MRPDHEATEKLKSTETLLARALDRCRELEREVIASENEARAQIRRLEARSLKRDRLIDWLSTNLDRARGLALSQLHRDDMTAAQIALVYGPHT